MNLEKYNARCVKESVEKDVALGSYAEISEGTPAESVEEVKKELARQAGQAVEKWILENDAFISRDYSTEYLEKCRQYKEESAAARTPEEMKAFWDKWGGFRCAVVDRTEAFMTLGWKVKVCFDVPVARREIVE